MPLLDVSLNSRTYFPKLNHIQNHRRHLKTQLFSVKSGEDGRTAPEAFCGPKEQELGRREQKRKSTTLGQPSGPEQAAWAPLPLAAGSLWSEVPSGPAGLEASVSVRSPGKCLEVGGLLKAQAGK